MVRGNFQASASVLLHAKHSSSELQLEDKLTLLSTWHRELNALFSLMLAPFYNLLGLPLESCRIENAFV
jgi:hypothetical protein